MSTSRTVPVADLDLDLANFRTVHQQSEADAVMAMVSTSPDRFWHLVESLLDDGYLPTESVQVLERGGDGQPLIVKEGNRRIAALKLILGLLDLSLVDVPDKLRERILGLTDEWKQDNREVPCVVYGADETELVDRIVTLAHGKGEKAGRDQWNAVARARHKRDAQGDSQPALDLLEKYLQHGQNHTGTQAARWAGDYPLTVLEEAMKKLAPRLGFQSSRELATAYPKMKGRKSLEQVIHAIGLKLIRFETIRRVGSDFGAQYGIPEQPKDPPKPTGDEGSPSAKAGSTSNRGGASDGTSEAGGNGAGSGPSASGDARESAVSMRKPRSVKIQLSAFDPKGAERSKIATLRDEAHALNLTNNPLAFCFVLRGMFEVSAKAYCKENAGKGGPSPTKGNGQEKHLVDILRDITNHLTKNKTDKAMLKALHGALTELARPEGLLSVTSMNQLIHNPTFSVTTSDICSLFGNVFPLLQAMNE